MTTSGVDSNAASGVVGQKWTPGYMPHIVRAFSMVNTSTVTALDSLVVSLIRRGQGATTVTGLATLYGTATSTPGSVTYKDGLNATVGPGDELQVDINTVASLVALMQYTVWVEPRWETPTNITNMKVTT